MSSQNSQYDRKNPSLFDVLAREDTLPIDPTVAKYWLINLKHPFRKTVMHVCRFGATVSLCTTYFLKRLLPIQFSAHRLLQSTICWFMKWFVTPEANFLILRHFWTESNIINFIIANSKNRHLEPVTLYPTRIRDLIDQTFVDHDVVLFNAIYDLGSTEVEEWPVPKEQLDFSTMRDMTLEYDPSIRKWTQFLDFETAHELFKALFCLLLTANEYERSINSLQFDQTLAMRVGRIVGDAEVASMAANVYPMFIVGPLHLSQRFVMHGLFTEHLHAYLERLRAKVSKVS